MKIQTLYPVRRSPRYSMSLERYAAEQQKPNISGELGALIGKFLERINRVVGPSSRDPVGDIQDELGIARVDYLSDVDFLMDVFAKNPLVGRTPLSSILPDPLPEHISLLHIVGSAVDRVLLQVATKWYKKQFGEAQQKAGSVEDSYLYYGDIPCYVFGVRTASDKGSLENLPYHSQPIMVFTTNYLDQLFKLREQNPSISEEDLVKKFPPNHKDVQPAAVGKAISSEPELALVNIAPILQEYQHGDVYSAARASLDAAVASNASYLVKHGGWSSRTTQDQLNREQQQLERQQADESVTQPAVPKHMPTQSPSSQMPMTQAPTNIEPSTRPAF